MPRPTKEPSRATMPAIALQPMPTALPLGPQLPMQDAAVSSRNGWEIVCFIGAIMSVFSLLWLHLQPSHQCKVKADIGSCLDISKRTRSGQLQAQQICLQELTDLCSNRFRKHWIRSCFWKQTHLQCYKYLEHGFQSPECIDKANPKLKPGQKLLLSSFRICL